jgi:hypothetical protein
MSFGKAIAVAERMLKAKGKLPPGLRDVDRNKRILDCLQKELGHTQLPSRWALARYFAVADATRTDRTFRTSTGDLLGGITEAEEPPTKG